MLGPSVFQKEIPFAQLFDWIAAQRIIEVEMIVC